MNNILFVDDDRSTLCLYELYLESSDYNAHLANDTNIAIEMFIENSYKIIITDYYMPNETGLEFALRVKKTCSKLNVRSPYIILASSKKLEETHGQHGAIFNLMLQKPLSRKILLSTLDSIIKKKE